MRLVVLSGPDGSGKTTLARMLRGYLYSRGFYAGYHWVRGSHVFTSVLARALSRFESFAGGENPYYGVKVPKSMRLLWVAIEFLSFLPHYTIRRLLTMLTPIIGDRGILDFIVWLIVTLDYPQFLNGILGGFLLRLALKERAILVTAEVETLSERSRNLPRRFIEREYRVYDVLAKNLALKTVDTTGKSPRSVLEELLRCERLKRSADPS